MFKTGACTSQETRWVKQKRVAAKFLHVVRDYLHRLLRRDPGSTDHERDLDVEVVQLPLIDGQRELT